MPAPARSRLYRRRAALPRRDPANNRLHRHPDPDRQQRRRLIVGVISAERVKLGVEGVQVETTKPVVSVWVEDGIAISLTADQARTLAGVLVESAQALT